MELVRVKLFDAKDFAKGLRIKIIDTNDKELEILEFETYQEAEDYVYGKYNCCWDKQKDSDGNYTFIVYAE